MATNYVFVFLYHWAVPAEVRSWSLLFYGPNIFIPREITEETGKSDEAWHGKQRLNAQGFT